MVVRRGRGKTVCAPGADQALLGGRSASPLGNLQRVVSHTDKRWRWGLELIACFDDLQRTLSQRTPPILDKEVIPDFGGSPDGLVLWVICDRRDEVASVEAQHADLMQLFQAQMTKRGLWRELA